MFDVRAKSCRRAKTLWVQRQKECLKGALAVRVRTSRTSACKQYIIDMQNVPVMDVSEVHQSKKLLWWPNLDGSRFS